VRQRKGKKNIQLRTSRDEGNSRNKRYGGTYERPGATGMKRLEKGGGQWSEGTPIASKGLTLRALIKWDEKRLNWEWTSLKTNCIQSGAWEKEPNFRKKPRSEQVQKLPRRKLGVRGRSACREGLILIDHTKEA